MKNFFKNKRLFGLSVSTSNAPTTPEPTTTAVPTTTPEPTTPTPTTTPPPCTLEYIKQLLKEIADYNAKIAKAKEIQLRLSETIDNLKKKKKKYEDKEKENNALASIAREWYEYYTNYQDEIKKATKGLGCWELKDALKNATTGNDAVDTGLWEVLTKALEKAAQAAKKLKDVQAEKLVKLGIGSAVVSGTTAIGTIGAIGLGIIGGVTDIGGFCTGLDVGRGTAYLALTGFEYEEAKMGAKKLKYASELREKENEMKKLRADIGEWFQLKNAAQAKYDKCFENSPVDPFKASIFKLQAVPCKTIQENLKISRNKMKKFYSKKLRLEADNDFRSDIKNTYQERIPVYKFEIKKLKNYRDRYFSDNKASFIYFSIKTQIKAYEKMILIYQKLSKKINYQNLKYGKELKAINEKYILEQQNYKDITKQLKNCTV